MSTKYYIYFIILLFLFLWDFVPFSECQRRSGNRRNNRRRQRPSRNCKPTTADLYGPYYRPGFPKLHSLCRRDAERDRRRNLVVSGHVYESNCRTKIPRARIEIWQADRQGKYFGTSRCRGYFVTNNSGYYRFSTVYPGKYQISMAEAEYARRRYNRPIGDRYRPAHIHFKVTGRRGHKSLVSQMYFIGDQNLGFNDSCVPCNSEHSDLVVQPRRVCKGNRCRNMVKFDIVLERGNGISVNQRNRGGRGG